MNRKQPEAPVGHSERTPVQVYVDPDHWARFDAVARAQNRSRSAQIRELIQRSVEEFEGQLDYIMRHYRVVSTRDVAAAARGDRALPPMACLLTFDDGFVDHFTTVLPRLLERGLTGSFYAPVAPIEERRVLDTHKIQIVLAAAPDAARLVRRVLELVDGFRDRCELPEVDALYRQHAQASRFDKPPDRPERGLQVGFSPTSCRLQTDFIYARGQPFEIVKNPCANANNLSTADRR